MSRIQQTSFEQATGERAEIYSGIKKSIGLVPNLYQAIGSSPRALKVLLGIGGGLKGGLISAADQESIALAVAQANGCDYCLSAHSAIGKMMGSTEEEIILNRRGKSNDKKREALLKLVSEIVTEKGRISDATYNGFLAAGFTEAHVPEVVMSVVQSIYTNYFNNLNQTEVDFPAAKKI